MTTILIHLIGFYRLVISPFIGPSCRFYPTCSDYAQQAISQYGPIRGSILTVKRLSKCHPFCEGGVDLVPPPSTSNTSSKV